MAEISFGITNSFVTASNIAKGNRTITTSKINFRAARNVSTFVIEERAKKYPPSAITAFIPVKETALSGLLISMASPNQPRKAIRIKSESRNPPYFPETIRKNTKGTRNRKIIREGDSVKGPNCRIAGVRTATIIIFVRTGSFALASVCRSIILMSASPYSRFH